MAEELVELTAAIQHELELARSGDGYEEAAVAGEIVERMVAPMLAARDVSFDQRLSDFREEYRKSSESWDRTRERLTVEGRLLLWLHAEAAWHRDQLDSEALKWTETAGEHAEELERWRSGQRHKVMPVIKEAPDGITYAARLLRAQGTDGGGEHDELLRNAGARLAVLTDVARRLLVDRDRVEASRQAWAEEAARLQQQRDEDEAPAPWDYPHEWRDNGGGDPYYNIKGDCRSCGRDFHDEIHDEPHGPRPVPPTPNAPCSCLAEGVTLPAGWVRPQCAVHPSNDAAPGPLHPEGSTEGHFRSHPQTDQRAAESTPECAVHPEGPEIDTPDSWCKRLGIHVLDPDGWRRDGKPWDEAVSEAEFRRRATWSTQAPWAPSAAVSVHPEGGTT